MRVAIVGAGAVGRSIAGELLGNGHAVMLIEKNAAWYLIHGRISSQRALAITSYIDDRLLPRIRDHALPLVAAFEFTPEHIGASIALGAEKERQDEAMEYYRALRASGSAPLDEKVAAKPTLKK